MTPAAQFADKVARNIAGLTEDTDLQGIPHLGRQRVDPQSDPPHKSMADTAR